MFQKARWRAFSIASKIFDPPRGHHRMLRAALAEAAQALILIEAAVTYVKSLLGGSSPCAKYDRTELNDRSAAVG